MGYLEQKPGFLNRTTLGNYLREAVRDILSIKEELSTLEKEMALLGTEADEDSLDPLMKRYGFLTQLYESKGGYTLENRINTVAQGMGFKKEDWGRSIEKFSGGEKTRAQLAALILQEPELLLLDEPTNYLDLEALGGWKIICVLARFSAGSIHDRYFLDRVVGRIASLERGELKCYRGNYSAYVAQRQLERDSMEKVYQKQLAW